MDLTEREFWFIFGKDPVTRLVDISNLEGDVLNSVPEDLAEKIIEQHNKALDRLEDLIRHYRSL